MTAAAPIEFKRFEKWPPKGLPQEIGPEGLGKLWVHPVVLIGGFYVFFSAYGSFETGDGYL